MPLTLFLKKWTAMPRGTTPFRSSMISSSKSESSNRLSENKNSKHIGKNMIIILLSNNLIFFNLSYFSKILCQVKNAQGKIKIANSFSHVTPCCISSHTSMPRRDKDCSTAPKIWALNGKRESRGKQKTNRMTSFLDEQPLPQAKK